jgi:hypothetical protein
MDHSPLDMTVTETRRLHNQIVQDYESWIDQAPLSYKEDGFFISSVPITVTSCCGQNQQVHCPIPGQVENYEEDVDSWSRIRDFSQIKYVSLAIASHVS